MDDKGQLTVLGLLFGFIVLLVFGALYPTLVDTTNTTATSAPDGIQSDLILLIPLIFIIVIITGIVLSGQPRFQQIR